ncbi:hypothetical protein I7I48_09678 [Histoplasma ohiense]|nr:hypothetical protein I7I48_09678 [Histoplasma ohiense (nom. inval.)]
MTSGCFSCSARLWALMAPPASRSKPVTSSTTGGWWLSSLSESWSWNVRGRRGRISGVGFEDEEEAALFVSLVVDDEDDGDGFFFCEEEAREMEKGFGFGLWSRSSEAIAATGVGYRSLG